MSVRKVLGALGIAGIIAFTVASKVESAAIQHVQAVPAESESDDVRFIRDQCVRAVTVWLQEQKFPGQRPDGAGSRADTMATAFFVSHVEQCEEFVYQYEMELGYLSIDLGPPLTGA